MKQNAIYATVCALVAGTLAACGAVPANPTVAPAPTAAPKPAATVAPPAATATSVATTVPKPAPTTAPSAATSKIAFLISGDAVDENVYRNLAKSFQAKNPGVSVEIQNIPSGGDYRKRIAADIAAGSPSDVVFMNYQRMPPFADRGQLQPIGDYLDKSSVIKEGDFYKEVMESYRWNGKIQCMPQNISSPVIYYNKKMFKEANVPYPKDDWTWDDMLSAAKALTKGEGENKIYGFGAEIVMFRVAPYIWSNGGDVVDNPARPTKLTLGSPEAVDAIQRYVDLQAKHKVAPTAAADKAEDAATRFMNGRLGMYMDSRRVTPTFRAVIKDSFDWDVAAIPRLKQPASILHSDAFCIPAAAKNKDGAWKFIEYANSPEGQTLMATTGRTVPSMKAVAESPAFLDPAAKPANSAVWLKAIPNIRPVPLQRNWPDIETLITKELEAAYYGRQTVQEAAQRASTLAADLLK